MDELMAVRKQLTLFVPEEVAMAIENVRQQYNPAQYQLIKSHVTLCREDELFDLATVKKNLLQLMSINCTIAFGKPLRFDDGKGLMLPALDDASDFQTLRALVLKDCIELPRMSMPHITLIHPRNGSCTDEIFEIAQKLDFPSSIRFDNIHLIEQCNGGKWQSLHRWPM